MGLSVIVCFHAFIFAQQMNKHEKKTCPRCNDQFTCRVGDIVRCQCADIDLSYETRQFLEIAYIECLCKRCLVEIDMEVKTAGGNLGLSA